jgi:2-polyprenyl-3-methyl-5-hydroxy-6-metoxy-1,4-benzoquinol methylase
MKLSPDSTTARRRGVAKGGGPASLRVPSDARRPHSAPRDKKLNPQDDWESRWTEHAYTSDRNPGQAYRRRLVLETLGELGVVKHILDLGSGRGDLAQDLAHALPGVQVVGIDRSHSGVDAARTKVPAARFFVKDLLEEQETPETGALRGWADVATCVEVVEHQDDPEGLLRNVRRYLAPGGVLIVTAPGGPLAYFDRHIGHRRHYRAHALRALVERSGFRVERVCSAGFPFFNLYKLVAIARGRGVVQIAAAKEGDRSVGTQLAYAAFEVFHRLFALNAKDTPWGWQMFLVARA